MTLSEYLNQACAVWHPIVILTEDEYVVHQTVKTVTDTLRCIEIPALHERFGVNGIYIQKNNEIRLYCQDEHGNPRSLSVFNI